MVSSPGGQPAHLAVFSSGPCSVTLLWQGPGSTHSEGGLGVIPAEALPSPCGRLPRHLWACAVARTAFWGCGHSGPGAGLGASGRELSPALYSRRSTRALGPGQALRAVAPTAPRPTEGRHPDGVLPSWQQGPVGNGGQGEEQDGSALRPPLRQCDGRGPSRGRCDRAGVIPGLVARQPPQRPRLWPES